MTTLREAAAMALRSMEEAVTYAKFARAENYINPDAIKSLREALAQREPEPVVDTEADVLTAVYMTGVHAGKKAATKRKPLTDDEIARIMQPFEAVEPEHPFWVDVARAIEQAHGIGERE